NGGFVNGRYAEKAPDELMQPVTITATSEVPLKDIHKKLSEPSSKVNTLSGLSEDQIESLFEDSALAGHDLGEAILHIEETYGINAFFTIAVMKLESGHGKSKLAKTKNNLF